MTPAKKRRRSVDPVPFLRGRYWWARVPSLEGTPVQRPLGVVGKEHVSVAKSVCAFLSWCRNRREAFLLEWMAGPIEQRGRSRVGAAYTAYAENRLESFIAELRDGIRDTDLEPYVAKWQSELARKKKPNAQSREKYERQVRTLMPKGEPFRKSAFTKQRVRDWLDDLSSHGVSQTNRYRTALSSFAEFLCWEDVIPANVVRRVPMVKESEPRTKHLTQIDAKKLLEAMKVDPRERALHAAMLATGMEFGAAQRIDPATCTDSSAYADGTKRQHRKRTCTVYDRWSWAWKIALEEIEQAKDGSHPFASIDVHRSARALKRALKAAELDADYTQHDHRHSWAVQAIRDGIALHVIAHQLGHRDAMMVNKVYGRFIPTAADFKRTSSATNAGETVSKMVSSDHE